MSDQGHLSVWCRRVGAVEVSPKVFEKTRISRDGSIEIDQMDTRYNCIGLLYHHLQQAQDAGFYDHWLDLGNRRWVTLCRCITVDWEIGMVDNS